MTTSSLILLVCVSAAFVAALIAVIYNRRQLNRLRMQHREPVLGNSISENIKKDILSEDCEDSAVSEVRIRTTEQANNINPNTENVQRVPQSYDVITLSVMAEQDRPYMGYELLQSLLASGLRYGNMKIFHRHEQLNGQGRILFSLASATKPGIFELDKMSTVVCKGLTLFMQPSLTPDLRQTFELMLETAKQLVEDLGGQLYDEKRELLTEQKIQELRDSLSLSEHGRATIDMFE